MDLKTLESASGPTLVILVMALIVQARFLFTRMRRVLRGFRSQMVAHEKRDDARAAALTVALGKIASAFESLRDEMRDAAAERVNRPRPRRKKKGPALNIDTRNGTE